MNIKAILDHIFVCKWLFSNTTTHVWKIQFTSLMLDHLLLIDFDCCSNGHRRILQVQKCFCFYFFLDNNQRIREAVKKNRIFYDIESKGGKVAVSKPNFLNIRNYDIYLRRVGKRLICHNSKTMNPLVNNWKNST